MRKIFWRLHSLAGLFAGVGLLLLGLTGSLLVFHEEIDLLLSPETLIVEPTTEGRLPLNDLVAAVEEEVPDHSVTGWRLHRENPRLADGVYVMPHGTREWHLLTVDPYRAEVLMDPKLSEDSLASWLLELHTSLFLGHFGEALAGILGVALCFLGLSGLWLYRRFWKSLLRLRFGASWRLMTGDFHRLVGVWSVGFNLLLGFTGAYWSLSHTFEDLFFPHEEVEEVLFYEKLFPASINLESLMAEAGDHVPGFETNYISFPWEPEGRFTLWGKPDDAAWVRSRYGSQVAFDATTGGFLSSYDLRDESWWAWVEDSFEPLHFGDFGGIWSKIPWAIAGLSPGLLCISGMSIWWSRRKGKRAGKKKVSR
ncbi:PepSY-associated TM helix domain-containing protein [Luteolibacter sp. AS25]|uniref:PepSY-associated TM helix domain-containing protein n=1 Tax=Luteolibacter sp. AS25 TaxID=3135776 RepID=UPI00398B2D4D